MSRAFKTFVKPLATPEKHWVGRSFGAAADSYDQVAQLQREVADRLLASLPAFSLEKGVIADLGCGTGYCTRHLGDKFPGSTIVAVDLAEGMLARAYSRCQHLPNVNLLAGDTERLPIASGSIDLALSNLSLQWCDPLSRAFAEVRRILRPGGRYAFSTFTEDTLIELRQAWASVDDYTHVNDFSPPDEVEQALLDSGFIDLQLVREGLKVFYPNVQALMRSLKMLGAHNVTTGRPRHLTGKGTLHEMIQAYPGHLSDGGITASFQVLIGQARAA